MTNQETVRVFLLLNDSGLIGAPDPSRVKNTIAVYADLLADIPLDQALRAVRAHLADTTPTSEHDPRPLGQWWPAPAAILQRVHRLDLPDRLALWTEVCALSSPGHSSAEWEARFPSGSTVRRAVLDIGGASAIRERLIKDNDRMRAAFVERLRVHQDAQKQLEVRQ